MRSEFSGIDRKYFDDFAYYISGETHTNICSNQPEHPLTTTFPVIIYEKQNA